MLFHLLRRSMIRGLGTPDVIICTKIEILFQRQSFNTCPRYVATLYVDNNVKVELECARVRTQTEQKQKGGDKSKCAN